MGENQLAVIVGENISLQRRKLGMSQKELAERLEISQDAMARMEKGKIAPKMGRLQDIADNLGCTVSYLFRTPGALTEEYAANIADSIKVLSPSGQAAMLDFVVTTVRVMQEE